MNNRDITPEMARAELYRRKAAKDEIERRKNGDSIMGNIAKIPGYAIGSAMQLPGNMINLAKEIPGASQKMLMHPQEGFADILGGIARGSQNLAATGLEAGEYLTRKGAEGIGKLLGKDVNVPKWNAREFAGLGEKYPVDLGAMIESKNPNQLLSQGGQYGLGGAAGGARLLPMIGANAAYGATQAKPGERIKAATEHAVGVGLPIGIAKGINELRPSKFLAKNTMLSPQQLAENLEAAQGTNTGLGDIVGSPGLKRLYENVLPHVPFTGASKTMQGTAGQLIEQGRGHLAKLEENLPIGDKTQILQDAIKKASIEASKENKNNYMAVNKIADKEGLVVPRDKFRAKAQEILDDINQSPELKRNMDQGLLADIESYVKNKQGNSLRLSNIFKGKLNDIANEYYINGNKHEYNLMRDLKNALGEDIEGSIKSSTNPDLKSAYDKAQKEYGLNYKQFEDPDIVKFTREGGDADIMLSHFLRTGQNDRANMLAKVTHKLEPEVKNLPAYMYLSKAIEEGQLNPLKMRTLYKNLGEKQRNLLISDPEMRKALNNYTKAVGMNTEAFNTMFNPKTGQRISDLIPTVGAMGGYSMMGGGVPGLIGGAAGIAIPGLVGKAGVKYLTNPKVREKLVHKIIKEKQKK
jgi:hypothetical protein